MNRQKIWIQTFAAFSLLATLCARADDCGPNVSLVGEATLTGSTLTFRLSSRSPSSIEIVRGFSHEQEMLLAVVIKRGAGEFVPRLNEFGGDPPIGTYVLSPNGSADETLDISHRWPGVLQKSGKAIIFWSTDVRVVTQSSSCTVRVSGSREVVLPLSKSTRAERDSSKRDGRPSDSNQEIAAD